MYLGMKNNRTRSWNRRQDIRHGRDCVQPYHCRLKLDYSWHMINRDRYVCGDTWRNEEGKILLTIIYSLIPLSSSFSRSLGTGQITELGSSTEIENGIFQGVRKYPSSHLFLTRTKWSDDDVRVPMTTTAMRGHACWSAIRLRYYTSRPRLLDCTYIIPNICNIHNLSYDVANYLQTRVKRKYLIYERRNL